MIVLQCLKPIQSLRCVVPKQVQKWTPPPVGLVCLNVDATIFSSSSSSSVGVVVRDHLGIRRMGCRQSFHGITTPEVAEALALRCAVTLALDEGLHRVMIQSDCLSL
uniref:RNase H type-1 domain-containing protein n=1 Tax=Setaria italica TaxID=4555 RepID=K3ZEB9_SETIT